MVKAFTISLLWSLLFMATAVSGAAEEKFDLVLHNGRVMDPETGLDAVRNVGIRNGVIAAITAEPISGARLIDVTGYVVSPGFIDAHTHGTTPMAYKLALRDGVTTAMDLEFGTLGTRVSDWYEARAEITQLNYGTGSSHELARSLVLDGIEALDASEAPLSRGGGQAWADMVPSDQQRQRILNTIDAGLAAGAIGLSSTVGYMPGATAREFYEAQKVAARYGRVSAVHTRHTPGTETTTPNGIQEMLSNAAALDAPALVMHFNNLGWELVQELIVGLRNNGHNIWGEVYPYHAGSTTINAVFLKPEIYEEVLGKRYEDTLFDPQTQTFYTKESYLATLEREPGRAVILYKMPEADIPKWLAMEGIVIGSDAMPIDPRYDWDTPFQSLPGIHPRTAGAHAKTLRLAREHNIPLMHAIAALSYRTARNLGDTGLESMQRRGRVQVGMVADLTVFHPTKVTDNATFAQGNLPSTGIDYVLVNGQLTVDAGQVLRDVSAGQPIRFPIR